MGFFGLFMVHGAWFHPIDENPVNTIREECEFISEDFELSSDLQQ
jgi:hypothetical protein